MSLKAKLLAAPKTVQVETYGEGERAFQVELRLCTRQDTNKIARMNRQIRDRTGQVREEADLGAICLYIQQHCIVGWSGLTVETFYRMCNRQLENGDRSLATTPVAFDPEDVLLLLEHGVRTETQLPFLDWVIRAVTCQAEEREKELEEEKKISGSTSAATSGA